MSYLFYNPNTMQNPGTILMGVHPADMSDPFVKAFMRPDEIYASREEALKESSSCQVYFYEDKIIYKALRVGAWQWKPCTDVECNSGINWHTYYAQSIDRLHEYLVGVYGKICNFKPILNSNGLYEIQVHYDGRCR